MIDLYEIWGDDIDEEWIPFVSCCKEMNVSHQLASNILLRRNIHDTNSFWWEEPLSPEGKRFWGEVVVQFRRIYDRSL